MSRKGDGSRGLYTIVYDDTESNNVIGYFMPDGQSACYHRNGSLHMMADSDGGLLLDDVSVMANLGTSLSGLTDPLK